MKVVLITLGFQPFRASGLDIIGERLVRGLLEVGLEVTVIAGRRGRISETYSHPLFHIYRLPLGRLDWIPFGYRAARLLEQLETFDIVHFFDVHFGWAYRRRFVASLHHSFQQRLDSLGKFSLHNSLDWYYKTVYYSLARSLTELPTCRRACRLLAVSAATRQAFIEQYHLDPEHITIARNGIDTTVFRRVPDLQVLRSRLGIHENEPVLLFSGFITPRKGLEYLAMALPLIQPRPRLVITGKWRSQAYRDYVWRYIEPVKDQVIETGFIPDEEMPAYYSLSDLYVSASLMEGFGLPLAEALACETPVVAADAGATVEVVGPGGIIVHPRDSKGLAEAISNLLSDIGRRQEMGHLGREHIVQNFSIKTMLRSTLEAYEHSLAVVKG